MFSPAGSGALNYKIKHYILEIFRQIRKNKLFFKKNMWKTESKNFYYNLNFNNIYFSRRNFKKYGHIPSLY